MVFPWALLSWFCGVCLIRVEVSAPFGSVLTTTCFPLAASGEHWKCLPTVSHLNQSKWVIVLGCETSPSIPQGPTLAAHQEKNFFSFNTGACHLLKLPTDEIWLQPKCLFRLQEERTTEGKNLFK